MLPAANCLQLLSLICYRSTAAFCFAGADSNDDDLEENLIPYLNEEDFDRVAQFIPDTVLRYLTSYFISYLTVLIA